ncbi:MAG: transposase [Bacteroidetes bacterium]|nr:transposase [Bacteroidota bacterium]
MGEKKELVRSYMAQGLTRNKALSICKISKNQFYYKETGGKRGRKRSKTSMQLVNGVEIEKSNHLVVEFIKSIFENPKIDYGYRKITSELQLSGFVINHKKVYRLMKAARLLRQKKEREPKNYVQYRIVCPVSPLRLIEMDIKQVWLVTERRYAYILTVIDVFTRFVLNWTCGYHMKQEKVQEVWMQIIEDYLQPWGDLAWDVDIEVRSDNGPQFCAKKLQDFLKKNYLMQTFTHPYTPQENGHVESFHAILSKDLQGKSFDNLDCLENSLKEFYDFYNFERIHGSTLHLPPTTFWHQWELGNVHREVIDINKRKVKFSLNIKKQLIQKVKLSGNRNQREVLSQNFEGFNTSPSKLGVIDPINFTLSKQTAPN